MSKPLIVDFEGLKALGWPYGKTQTWRLMRQTITISRKAEGKRRVTTVIPNPDIFPASHKICSHFNSPPMWKVSEVLRYFEARGLRVTDDWNRS